MLRKTQLKVVKISILKKRTEKQCESLNMWKTLKTVVSNAITSEDCFKKMNF